MIPAAIQALLPQHSGEENHIGHSGAQVVMYEDCVLKVQPDTGNAANEGIMLRFLKGRLPVPEVLAEAVQGGMRYLLMTRLRGRMLCDETFLDNQPLLARRMADAAEMLWNVPAPMCWTTSCKRRKQTSPLGSLPLTPRISRTHTAQADLHRRKRCWHG